ncbi:multidrug transporter [Halopseudomonas sp.]|uniref:multidrug transporter n=1 Tax=Halopseudomonas sp. TaxID=2901191 RepID=UPI003563A031
MRLLRHTTALMAGLLLSAAAQAVEPNQTGYVGYTDEPGYFAMIGDLLIARPLLAGVTAIGAAAFVVSLPFTLAAGNTAEAGRELVVRPGEATFVRCLGCTKSGYGRKHSDERR